MEQIGIALFGVTAIFLSQDKDENRRKYACIFGLIGQPFWLYTAYSNQQWGVLILSILYTYSWYRGIKNNWINTKDDNTDT